MRIAILNWSRQRVGGVETYLDAVIPGLLGLGHEVAFWYESDQAGKLKQISLPASVPSWCVSELGAEKALSALRAWQPDLIYTHVINDAGLENQTLKIAPAIYFAHGYFGTCVSGTKTFKAPHVKPCTRTFGWQCLLHYYPHRCGGLNPLTMLREYERQSARQKLLRRYKAIVTNSMHMQAELMRHGFNSQCLYLPVTNGFPVAQPEASRDLRLLFLGRMDFHKGGHIFIESLPEVCASLQKPVRVTFAGDGTERERWQHMAAQVQERTQNLSIEFVGWQNDTERNSQLNNCDLLVVPSLWPEPFGMVGPEAGLHRVPVAAFAVGGIQEWLVDGVNGYLAQVDRPTAAGLAQAIVKCLRDSETHERLKRGALESAQRFSKERHLEALLKVFESVLLCEDVETKA